MKYLIENYIKTWERRCYHDGIPDDAPKEIFDKVPSYKKIAMAILKNDISIIDVQRPQSKYYGMLKRIELKERNPEQFNQLTIFTDQSITARSFEKADEARRFIKENELSNAHVIPR